jgi:tetratricopeptide (TPR) repeat protein
MQRDDNNSPAEQKERAGRKGMSSSLVRKAAALERGAIFVCIAAMGVVVFSSVCRAQGEGIGNQTQMGTPGGMTDDLQYGTAGHGVEREQAEAYQVFLKERDSGKKIRLGNDFLKKYPKSVLAEQVDAGLMNVYRAQQDWKDTYLCADHALALQPDDVDVLTTVGWTIPHVYSPRDPNADQELNTAEAYAKHAIEVLAKMRKPAGLTEEQFAAAKTRRTFQAHSALGLVYFRREDYEHSASELEQSTKDNPIQDPTDLFVLGVDLQNLNQHSEAAAAFRGCGQIAGLLQDQCKKNADLAQAQVDQSKSK